LPSLGAKPIAIPEKVGFLGAQPTLQLCRTLAVDAADAQVFDLEKFLDAVFRASVNYQIGPTPLSFMPPKGRSR